MNENKTTQGQQPNPNPTIKGIEGIKQELENINKTIVTRNKQQMSKDITTSYPLEVYNKATEKNKCYPKGSIRININLVTDIIGVTFGRTFINTFISRKVGLSSVQMVDLNSFVSDKELYQAFNLWVGITIKSYKGDLLKE